MSIRYRIEPRRFRDPLIVLQVSEQGYANYDPSDPRDFPRPENAIIRWRDARPDDLDMKVRDHD